MCNRRSNFFHGSASTVYKNSFCNILETQVQGLGSYDKWKWVIIVSPPLTFCPSGTNITEGMTDESYRRGSCRTRLRKIRIFSSLLVLCRTDSSQEISNSPVLGTETLQRSTEQAATSTIYDFNISPYMYWDCRVLIKPFTVFGR